MSGFFKVHVDPNQVWLQVDLGTLRNYNLTPDDFTNFSFLYNGDMYLEEEIDAEIFMKAYELRNKTTIRILKVVHNYFWLRETGTTFRNRPKRLLRKEA